MGIQTFEKGFKHLFILRSVLFVFCLLLPIHSSLYQGLIEAQSLSFLYVFVSSYLRSEFIFSQFHLTHILEQSKFLFFQ